MVHTSKVARATDHRWHAWRASKKLNIIAAFHIFPLSETDPLVKREAVNKL